MSYFETVRCELLMYFDVVISIALKRLWQRKRIVVLCVIMMAGALGLTATVVSLRKLANKARSTISDSLSGALSCYGEINIEMQGLSSDEKGEIFESIINLPSIKSIGSISELFVFNLRDENGKSDTWKCIRKEQINHPLVFSETKLDLPEGIASSEIVQSVVIPVSLWSAFDFALSEGEGYEAIGGAENLIYLGYNFSNCASVGDVLSDGQNQYRVAGILKKGSHIPKSSFLFWNNSMSSLGGMSSIVLDSTTSLDNLILFVTPRMSLNQLQLISWSEDWSIEEIERQIQNITGNYNLKTYICPLDKKLDDDLQINEVLSSVLRPVSLVMGICSVILIICSQLLSILKKKNDLGILLTQGFSRGQVYRILLLENFVQLLLASIFAPIVIRWIMIESNMSEAVREVFWKNILGPVGVSLSILVLGATAISSAIVLFMMRLTSSAAWVKGELKNSSLIYSGLYIVSFTVCLGLVWYGLTLKTHSECVEQVRLSTNYHYLELQFDHATASRDDFIHYASRFSGNGHLAFVCSLSVNRAAYGNTAFVFWGKTDELVYPLLLGEYPAVQRKTEAPACVVGEGLLKSCYVVGGIRYIRLDDKEYEVTGILESNHFSGFDYRIWVFADTVPEEMLDEYYNTPSLHVLYYKNGEITASEADAFVSEVRSVLGEDFKAMRVRAEYDDGSSESIASLYSVVCKVLLLISMFSLVTFSFLWSTRQRLAHMIMRVNGYSRFHIILHDAFVILKYEFAAILIVMGVTFLIAVFTRAIEKYAQSIYSGAVDGLLLFTLLGVASTVVVSSKMLRDNPAIVLKHTE